MIPLPELMTFLVTALIIIVVPGPGVLFVVGRALVLGTGGALVSVLGNSLGVAVQVVVVAAGLGAVVSQSDELFLGVKVTGALLLMWLGLQAIRHRHDLAGGASAVSTRTRTLLRDSAMVGLTNPKTMVFFVAALPQAIGPEVSSPLAPMLLLGAIFVVIGIVSDGVWALAAGRARAWLASSEGRIAVLRAIGGAALMVLGLVMALTAPLS